MPDLHPQLVPIAEEFLAALDRLHALERTVPGEGWAIRRDPARWSVSECVAHLNLTSAAYLPLLQRGVEEARALGAPDVPRYRRDLAGWLLWLTMGPPVRLRTRTVAAFVPESVAPPAELVAEFEHWQDALMALLHASSGLPLGQVWIASPFNARLRYNLYACFGILVRHQHRHLWQAEQTAGSGKW